MSPGGTEGVPRRASVPQGRGEGVCSVPTWVSVPVQVWADTELRVTALVPPHHSSTLALGYCRSSVVLYLNILGGTSYSHLRVRSFTGAVLLDRKAQNSKTNMGHRGREQPGREGGVSKEQWVEETEWREQTVSASKGHVGSL